MINVRLTPFLLNNNNSPSIPPSPGRAFPPCVAVAKSHNRTNHTRHTWKSQYGDQNKNGATGNHPSTHRPLSPFTVFL